MFDSVEKIFPVEKLVQFNASDLVKSLTPNDRAIDRYLGFDGLNESTIYIVLIGPA